MRSTELALEPEGSRSIARENFRLGLVVLFAIEFVRGAFLVSYLPLVGAGRLHFAATVVGLAVSIHYLADSAVKLLVGFALERMSARLALALGAALTAAGIGLAAHAGSPGELYAAMAATGVGTSPVWLVCVGLIDNKKRAEQMGTLYLIWMAGLGLGPVLINFVLDAAESLGFAILIGMLAAGGFAALRMPAAAASAPPSGIRQQAAEARERIRRMGPLLAVTVLQTLAGSMLVPLLTPFTAVHFGWSHGMLSTVMVTGGACAVGLLVPMGKAIDRFGGRRFLVGGSAVFAAALAAVPGISRFWQAELAAVLLGVAYAALLPAWNAELARHLPEQACGTGWGLISTIEGAGVMAGPAAGGWLADRFRDTVPFFVCSLIFAAISVFFLLGRGRRSD